MKIATTAEVRTALRSLLAHLKPLDADRNHYKRRVIARLKKELLPKKPRKKVEKLAWFRDWTDDAFDAYLNQFELALDTHITVIKFSENGII